MSRAFIKEDAGDDDVPERPLPQGPNYVTPSGMSRLRETVRKLEAAQNRSIEEKRELTYWRARLGSAILVDNSKRPPDDVPFGATVELAEEHGESRRVRIVGQDEAASGGDLIAWDSIAARELLGHRVGDFVACTFGTEAVSETVRSIRYE